jgi:hypothetical protein
MSVAVLTVGMSMLELVTVCMIVGMGMPRRMFMDVHG